MDHVERFMENGLRVTIYQDTDPESPRKWDNVGIMACAHRNYDLGDRKLTADELEVSRSQGWDAFVAYLKKEEKATHVLPLGLLDHSGLTMYIGRGAHRCDPGGWDSGIVGAIYTTKALCKKIGVSPKNVETALEQEVAVYDQYLQGDVYGYVVQKLHADCQACECPHHDTLDSCWGYYGIEEVRRAAKEAAKGVRS